MPTFNTHLVLFLLLFFAPFGVEGFVSGVFFFFRIYSETRPSEAQLWRLEDFSSTLFFCSRIQRVSGSKPYTHECKAANDPHTAAPAPPPLPHRHKPSRKLLFLNLQPMAFFIFFYTLLIYQQVS